MSNFIEPEMVRIIHKKPEKVMTITMVHLPKGKFLMGEGDSQKEVSIDYEFEIGKYAVTIGEYMNFVEDTNTHYPEWLEEGNKHNLKMGSDKHYRKINQNSNAPIVGISWDDAVAYCKWLSGKRNQNYRLPTANEWEYACRAGTTTKWSFGDDENKLDEYAVYSNNSNSKAEEVGSKLANPWGLYDMHGNVWEWCEDWYDEEKDWKVLCGGAWNEETNLLRSACQFSGFPFHRSYHRGFRLFRTLP